MPESCFILLGGIDQIIPVDLNAQEREGVHQDVFRIVTGEVDPARGQLTPEDARELQAVINNQIRALGQNQVEAVIDRALSAFQQHLFYRDLHKRTILVAGDYVALKQNENKGVITHQEAAIRGTQIRDRMITILFAASDLARDNLN